MYLLEINRRPIITNPEKSNLLNTIRIKDMKTKWKSKDVIRKQWFLIDRKIVFHSWYDCVYKTRQISSYRKNQLILEMLKKSVLVLGLSQGPVWKKLIMNSTGICMFALAHCVVCVRNVFHVINKHFNSIDKSFIVNC